MALNPDHPGWYRFSAFFNEYRQGHYKDALDIAERINIPGYFAARYASAISHAQLGNGREATAALEEFVALWPNAKETFKEKASRCLVFRTAGFDCQCD